MRLDVDIHIHPADWKPHEPFHTFHLNTLQIHCDFHTNLFLQAPIQKCEMAQKKNGREIGRNYQKCCKYHGHEMLNFNVVYCVVPQIGGVIFQAGSPRDWFLGFFSVHILLSFLPVAFNRSSELCSWRHCQQQHATSFQQHGWLTKLSSTAEPEWDT